MKEEQRKKVSKLSFEIFSEISNELYGELRPERYLDHFDLVPTNISSSVLIMGINGSSTDVDTKKRNSDPCYVHFIPESLKTKSREIRLVTNNWGHGESMKKFCYPGYFGRIYNLFENTTYYPLYVSEDYNQRWMPLVNSVDKKDKFILSRIENPKIHDFIIIQDLIPFKETNSQIIISVLNRREDIVEGLNTLLQMKIKFLKPRLTIIFLKKANSYFGEVIKNLDCDILVFPFIKYLAQAKYLEIQKTIVKRIGVNQAINMNKKWDYVNEY